MVTQIEQVREVLKAFGFKESDLARAMRVAPFTVSRWLSGRTRPVGLHRDVINALYLATKKLREDPERRNEVAGRVRLGIGSLIHYGLKL